MRRLSSRPRREQNHMPRQTRCRRAAAALCFACALGLADGSSAAEPFEDWLEALKTEALASGISAPTLERAFADVRPIPRVIELDRRQPEFTLTFEEYLERVVPPLRVEKGRTRLAEYGDLLARVGAAYGVQPRFIVALWGIETDFGRITGGFNVIGALATLAYDGRRSAFFRTELLNALMILEQGHITAERMVGSWAGAMGQSQFMPSSFLSRAVDFDGDGRRDIWDTKADVFASAANYLKRAGWRDDQTWGRKVRLPAKLDRSVAEQKTVLRLSEWQARGVRRVDGGDLPSRDLRARLVLPGGDDGPAYLVYGNYEAILRWNRSNYFAVAVGSLADRIADR